MERRAHIIVTGRVQGVYFRSDARSVAAGLGLRGYVKNLPDGSVEIMAEGEEDRLAEFIRWARVGPPAARVDDLRLSFIEPTHTYSGFHVSH